MNLLPQPWEIMTKEGIYAIRRGCLILTEYGKEKEERFAAGLLAKEIALVLGLDIQILPVDKMEDEKGIRLCYKGNGDPESYELNITRDYINLSAADAAGVLYGVQTLRQLIREYGADIPCMDIIDRPAIAVRGYNHDVTRGRIPTLDELKRIADTCSFYKINQLQLNVEHSYLFRGESEVWRGSTPLTAEEITELDDYCRQRHIDLVPCLASFGHLYELLRSRSYKEYCELEVDVNEPFYFISRMDHHTVDVTNPGSYKLITGRIREYMNLFSSKYFNICADETFDLGKGKSRDKVEQEGAKEVYIKFLKSLCDYVISCGKIPMYWGDIIIEKPDIINQLPREGICLNWEYDPNVKEDNLKKLAATGAPNIFVCPGVQSWNHLINNHKDAYANISGMCVNAHKYHVQGVLNTDWGDLGHIGHPEFSTVGLIYGAAFSWNDSILPEEECDRRISLIQYGDRSGRLMETLREFGDCECMIWWHFVQYKEEMQKNGTAKVNFFMDAAMADSATDKIVKSGYLVEDLYKELHLANADTKKVINSYILMARGQELVGRVFMAMRRIAGETDGGASENAMLLAAELEKWFMDYKELWRSVSKESELYRLSDVIFWYADRLRDYTL